MSEGSKCPRCGARCESELDLKMHILAVHACTVPGCKILLKNQAELYWHLTEDHGVQPRHGGLEVEIPELSFERIPGWTPQPVPSRIEDLYRWLWPICLQIASATEPSSALDEAPMEQADQVAYIRQNFGRIANTLPLARYKRLRDPEARAAYLVIALAHKEYKASYALQKMNPEDVRRAVQSVG